MTDLKDWRLVPKRPTEDMCWSAMKKAGEHMHTRQGWQEPAEQVYRAMLSAAPTPPVTISSLQERIERLEAGLRPFAEAATYYPSDADNDVGVPMALKHCHRAAALLAEAKPEGETHG